MCDGTSIARATLRTLTQITPITHIPPSVLLYCCIDESKSPSRASTHVTSWVATKKLAQRYTTSSYIWSPLYFALHHGSDWATLVMLLTHGRHKKNTNTPTTAAPNYQSKYTSNDEGRACGAGANQPGFLVCCLLFMYHSDSPGEDPSCFSTKISSQSSREAMVLTVVACKTVQHPVFRPEATKSAIQIFPFDFGDLW